MLRKLWQRINAAVAKEAEEYAQLYRAAMALSSLTGEGVNEIMHRSQAMAKERQCPPVDVILAELRLQGILLQYEGKRAKR